MRDAMALWECSSKYIISDAHSLFFMKNLCYDRPFLPQSEHKFHNSPRVNGGYCVRVPSEPWVVIVYYKRIFLCQLFWNQMFTRNHKKIERQTVLAQTKLIIRTSKRAMLNNFNLQRISALVLRFKGIWRSHFMHSLYIFGYLRFEKPQK